MENITVTSFTKRQLKEVTTEEFIGIIADDNEGYNILGNGIDELDEVCPLYQCFSRIYMENECLHTERYSSVKEAEESLSIHKFNPNDHYMFKNFRIAKVSINKLDGRILKVRTLRQLKF